MLRRLLTLSIFVTVALGAFVLRPSRRAIAREG